MRKKLVLGTILLLMTYGATLFAGYCYDRFTRDVQRTVDLYLGGTYTVDQYAFYLNIAYAEYDVCLLYLPY